MKLWVKLWQQHYMCYTWGERYSLSGIRGLPLRARFTRTPKLGERTQRGVVSQRYQNSACRTQSECLYVMKKPLQLELRVFPHRFNHSRCPGSPTRREGGYTGRPPFLMQQHKALLILYLNKNVKHIKAASDCQKHAWLEFLLWPCFPVRSTHTKHKPDVTNMGDDSPLYADQMVKWCTVRLLWWPGEHWARLTLTD